MSKIYTKDELIKIIKDSRQNFYHKEMMEAQRSLIGVLCEKLDIDVLDTLSENPYFNTDVENEEKQDRLTADEWLEQANLEVFVSIIDTSEKSLAKRTLEWCGHKWVLPEDSAKVFKVDGVVVEKMMNENRETDKSLREVFLDFEATMYLPTTAQLGHYGSGPNDKWWPVKQERLEFPADQAFVFASSYRTDTEVYTWELRRKRK